MKANVGSCWFQAEMLDGPLSGALAKGALVDAEPLEVVMPRGFVGTEPLEVVMPRGFVDGCVVPKNFEPEVGVTLDLAVVERAKARGGLSGRRGMAVAVCTLEYTQAMSAPGSTETFVT